MRSPSPVVTVRSALDERYALWRALLCEDFGYEERQPVRPPRSENELAFRAVRPAFAPVQAVTVDIHETWLPGHDLKLGFNAHGCFLALARWHAQLVGDAGATGAERLDVDRSKPSPLLVHRHPLGSANSVRLPATPLMHPDAWVEHIEQLIAEYYGY